MKFSRGCAVLLILIGCHAGSQVQAWIFPSFGWGRAGFGFGVGGRHHHLSFFASSGYGFGYPAGYGFGFYPGFGYPYYPAFNRVTVVQYYAPPVVMIPPPQPFWGQGVAAGDDVGMPLRGPLPAAAPRDPRLPANGGMPRRPADPGRDRVRRPPERLPQPPLAPEPDEAAPKAPPVRPPENLPAPVPSPRFNDDPLQDSARLIALGKSAFASQEYGRAAERFRQAMQADPQDPWAYFLLAQSQFALGKYRETVLTIQAGMRLRPDWPSAPFSPSELYGDHAVEWSKHLRQLDDTLVRFPRDPVLLFLYGYELWFDGRKNEARLWFQRAAKVSPDRSFSERFLLAGPMFPAV